MPHDQQRSHSAALTISSATPTATLRSLRTIVVLSGDIEPPCSAAHTLSPSLRSCCGVRNAYLSCSLFRYSTWSAAADGADRIAAPTRTAIAPAIRITEITSANQVVP